MSEVDRFVVVPAVYLVLRRIVDGRREVLLQFRQGTDYMDRHWACGAAGHVEEGESVWTALSREAREELGIDVDPSSFVPLSVLQRRSSAAAIDQRVDVFIACDSWEGTPHIQEPDKAGDLGWFSLDDLPEPVVPHELFVLDGLRTGDLPHLAALGFDDGPIPSAPVAPEKDAHRSS